jgi:hypothetical protein
MLSFTRVSVADPDPNPDPSDPYVFGPPGSGSKATSWLFEDVGFLSLTYDGKLFEIPFLEVDALIGK